MLKNRTEIEGPRCTELEIDSDFDSSAILSRSDFVTCMESEA